MTTAPAATPAQSVQSPLAGILWMLATTLCFVAVNGIVHYLGTELPAVQGAFIRFAWGFVFLIPMLTRVLRQTRYSGREWGLFGLRGVFHTIGVGLWFFAMAHIPMAEVTAIGYLNPIVVTLGAALFFGERLTAGRALAGVVALIGALVILRPGLREIAAGHWAQLAAALFFGLGYLTAKRLSQFAPASVVVAMMSVTVTLFLAPFALAVWTPVSLVQVLWLGGVALFATAGHYCMTRAFTAAPLAVTQPVVFLQLLWAAILGMAVFGEPVDPWVIAGGALIIAAISGLAWREQISRRRARTTAPTA
ncbi:DMT family transporter [Phaeovulum vinaykumarii]|uniref:EamA domain-containing membrane protein RarD n=1 Tax=Phaeovulum vinaykumarii TaxID=407234 RepID=A0A1N7L1E9_9RHOB|nr:DMT family transporter [Phaeovulum vinaykumarii]SIS67675.1 EamA domain-containing membrane protein RarD [Phaeovulum vinaykumarii]SOC00614.1 EamA domain-containing membrane protein RarD [Phaeovulum vinaykumarii]